MVGADLVVLWGINAAYSSVNVMTLVKQARQRGARVVTIDPYRTPTAQQADEHLMVRPGTDAALALGVMHVLIAEGRLDHAYIERATLGFDRLAEHVKAWAPRQRPAIVAIRPSQGPAATSPAPLGPTRRSGVSTRSGECTRSAYARTLPQITPRVKGWSGSPVTSARRPSSTVTRRPHAEGQS